MDNSTINSISAGTLLKRALIKIQNLKTRSLGVAFTEEIKNQLISIFDGHLSFRKETNVFTGPGYQFKAKQYNTLYLITQPKGPNHHLSFIVRYVNKTGVVREVHIVCISAKSHTIRWPQNRVLMFNDIVIFNNINAMYNQNMISIFKGLYFNNGQFNNHIVAKYTDKIKNYANSISIELNQLIKASKPNNAMSSSKFVLNPYFNTTIRSTNALSNIQQLDCSVYNNIGDIPDSSTVIKAMTKRRLYLNESIMIAQTIG